jgi:hypothetical protein
MPDAFFARAGATFAPRPHARSPWAADMLHGRLLAGLAARELSLHHGEGGLQVGRLTVDMFRVAPMAPVEVTAERVRDGRRVRAVDVHLCCEGVLVARAAALLLAPGSPPPGTIWGPGGWDVPLPSALPAGERTPEAEAMGAPELRVLGGGLTGAGPHRAWLREPWPLVDGEPLDPVGRAVIAADVANPLSNWGSEGLGYINADLTVQLVRAPDGEWIGLEVVDHVDEGGISVGACRLHDLRGPIGECQVVGVTRSFAR